MPEPEQPAKQEQPASDLVPVFADPLAGMTLDRAYTPDQLQAELESIREDAPLIEGAL